MSTKVGGMVALPGDGRTIRSPIGGAVTFLARGDETNGALSVLSVGVPPLEGPPLHVHRGLDEAIYVLAGDFRWKLADELRRSPAGSFIFIPRGLAHCFQNIGDDEGRMLITFAPAGMEAFFEQQTDLAAFDLDVFKSAAAQEGMDVVGPPLAQSDPL
jgi:quercetin dioxygenase-like cupin family protein